MLKFEFPAGMVLYTDGGERRFSGYGIHGYVYDSEKVLDKNNKKSDVPTNIGYLNQEDLNTQTLKLVKPTHYVDVIHGLNAGVSNNAAELKAAEAAVTLAIEAGAKELTVLTDSKLVVQGITEWLPKWQANNWNNSQGNPVANREIWEALNSKVTDFKDKGSTVTWKWVKGHNGNLGNELADMHATFGIVAANKGDLECKLTLKDSAKYWSPSADFNRFIGSGKLYFQTNCPTEQTENGRVVYYCGDHGKDSDDIGKRVPDASYSVVYLEKPDPVIEMLKDYQNKISDSSRVDVVVAYLGNILNSGNYSRLVETGNTFLNAHPVHKDIYLPASNAPKVADTAQLNADFVSGYQLTEVRRPPLLAFKAITRLNQLQSFLNDFLANRDKTTDTVVTDITAHLYETETTKKGEVCKLLKSVTTSMKSLKVPVNYRITDAIKQADVVLTLGIDLPTRNTLNAIAEESPKVYVLTYLESTVSFRYVTVIESAKNVGIFSSVHSNLKVLKEP